MSGETYQKRNHEKTVLKHPARSFGSVLWKELLALAPLILTALIFTYLYSQFSKQDLGNEAATARWKIFDGQRSSGKAKSNESSPDAVNGSRKTRWSLADNARISTEADRFVNTVFDGEFGYELVVVLPYAYWHYLNGSLNSTSTCSNDVSQAQLYFFSPHHEMRLQCRRNDWRNIQIKRSPYLFTKGLHASSTPVTWAPPPLAEYMRQKEPVWALPPGSKLVVISNKYEREWDGDPVNFLDVRTLVSLIQRFLRAGFHVAYNRPGASIETDQRQRLKVDTLGDLPTLASRFGNESRFRTVQGLLEEQHRGQSSAEDQPGHRGDLPLAYNDVQWRLMARSRCFVSIQGGNSIVASYFGGTNIIYAVKGLELTEGKPYQNLYPKLSNATVIPVHTTAELARQVGRMIRDNGCLVVPEPS